MSSRHTLPPRRAPGLIQCRRSLRKGECHAIAADCRGDSPLVLSELVRAAGCRGHAGTALADLTFVGAIGTGPALNLAQTADYIRKSIQEAPEPCACTLSIVDEQPITPCVCNLFTELTLQSPYAVRRLQGLRDSGAGSRTGPG